jgi:acyl carrier protein
MTIEMHAVDDADPSSLEQEIVSIWAAMLELDSVEVDEDFFELGGDSLMAAELQIQIDRRFGVEVPASVIYRTPTIAQLARAVRSARCDEERSRVQA